MMSLFENVWGLFYPEVCPACGTLLAKDEDTVCLSCSFLMPKTAYETIADNPVARIFWGRVPLHAVSACFFFAKKGRVQPLIHSLKYHSDTHAGNYLGRKMAENMKNAPLFSDIEVLVPVPLHPKRLQLRGYNQSEVIAKGMAEVLGISVVADNLIREVATATQTKKSREARWQNVKNIFTVSRPAQFEGKHILLIDDVITTGSTIEACAQALLDVTGVKVSVAAAAYAP